MLAVVVVLLGLAAIGQCDPATLSQEMIDYINNVDTTWKAGPSFPGRDEKYIRKLCGVREWDRKLPEKKITPLEAIPDEFDSRTNWPNCPSLRDIRDQADCGSCWVSSPIMCCRSVWFCLVQAFGAVEAMSDRYCIAFQMHVNISAADMNSCCMTCGNG